MSSSESLDSLSIQERLESENCFSIFISVFQSLNINIMIDQSFKKYRCEINCALVVSRQEQKWLMGKGIAKTQVEAKNAAAKKALNMFMTDKHPIKIKATENALEINSSSNDDENVDSDTSLPSYMVEARNKIRALINGDTDSETLISKLASLNLQCDEREIAGKRTFKSSVGTDDNSSDIPFSASVVEEILLQWDFFSFMHLRNAFKKYSVDVMQVYVNDGAIVECWLTVSSNGQTWILGQGKGRTAEKARCNAARSAVKMFLANKFPVSKAGEEKRNELPDCIKKARVYLFKLANPIYQKLKELNDVSASALDSSQEHSRGNKYETIEKSSGSAEKCMPEEVANNLTGDTAEGHTLELDESKRKGRRRKNKTKISSQIESSVTINQQDSKVTLNDNELNSMASVRPKISANNTDQLKKCPEKTNQPRDESCGNGPVVQLPTVSQPTTKSVIKPRVKRSCSDFSELVEHVILYRESYEAMRNPYFFLMDAFSLCRIDFKFDSKSVPNGYETSLTIGIGEEDLILGAERGLTRFKSERILSTMVLEGLLKSCYTVIAKKRVANVGVICLSGLLDRDIIASSSDIPSQSSVMGIDNSVAPDWKTEVSFIFRRKVEELLDNMVQQIHNEELPHDLVFSSELSEQQTNYIESVIKEKEKYNMLTSEINDHVYKKNVIVSEKNNLRSIFKRVSAKGGVTEKFVVSDPGSLNLKNLKYNKTFN